MALFQGGLKSHCELLLHRGETGKIYNIGTNNELSNMEITRMILHPKFRLNTFNLKDFSRDKDKEMKIMISDICSFCRGKLVAGNAEFLAKVENEVVSIKGVPVYICKNCGEAYYTSDISKKIDEIMRDFHNGRLLARPIAAGEVELKLEA